MKSYRNKKIENGTVGFVQQWSTYTMVIFHYKKKKQERKWSNNCFYFCKSNSILPGEDLDAYPRKDEADKKFVKCVRWLFIYAWNFNYVYKRSKF